MNTRWSHVRLPRVLSYAAALVLLLCSAVGVHADNHIGESQPLAQAEGQSELQSDAAVDDASSEAVFRNCVLKGGSWDGCFQEWKGTTPSSEFVYELPKPGFFEWRSLWSRPAFEWLVES